MIGREIRKNFTEKGFTFFRKQRIIENSRSGRRKEYSGRLYMGVHRIRLPVSEEISILRTECPHQQHSVKFKCR